MKDLDVLQTLYQEKLDKLRAITNWNIALKIKLHGAS